MRVSGTPTLGFELSGLTDADIEDFVEHGFLMLRGCFDPDWAKARVRETLIEGTPSPRVTSNGKTFPALPDYGDPETWSPDARLDVETGFEFAIETLAPPLWDAIRALVGPGATVTRLTMGSQWIVAPNTTALGGPSIEEAFEPAPRKASEIQGWSWHLDTPGPATTLDGRHDALILLVMWSDFPEGGGGTLYSGESLTHVVRHLEERPDGCDTRGNTWANTVASRCADVRELSGRAGDVLVTHGFALHSSQSRRRSAFRVLENPTITVDRPLRYHEGVVDPSPVERAVIRRLRSPRSRPRPWEESALHAVTAAHPALFLPGRQAWFDRKDPAERERVMQTCEALLAAWVDTHARRIRIQQRETPLRCAEAAVGLLRQLVMDHLSLQMPLGPTRGQPPGFLFCDLVRGFVHADVTAQIIAYLLLPVFAAVRLATLEKRTVLVVPHEGANLVIDPRVAPHVFAIDAAGREQGLPMLDPDTKRALEHAPRLAPPVLEGVRHPSPEVLRREDADVWAAFLRVRVQHVLEGRPAPGSYASLLLEHRTSGTTKRVIEALARMDGRA